MQENLLTNLPTKNLADGLPVPLVTTMESTGSATAWITGNKIIIDLVDAAVDKYVNISTPINFEVLDVYTRHDDSTACAIQVANTTSDISDAISLAASDTDIDRAGTIDNDYASFSNGDNDLRLKITTDAANARVVIIIDK